MSADMRLFYGLKHIKHTVEAIHFCRLSNCYLLSELCLSAEVLIVSCRGIYRYLPRILLLSAEVAIISC